MTILAIFRTYFIVKVALFSHFILNLIIHYWNPPGFSKTCVMSFVSVMMDVLPQMVARTMTMMTLIVIVTTVTK